MDIDNFEILIKEKKEYENLLHSLHFSIQIGKFNNSIQLIKKLRHSKFRNQNFFYNIAFLFFQKENYVKASYILKKLEKKYGFNEKASNLLIESLILSENYNEAKKIIDKVLSFNSSSVFSFYSLGIIHLELGNLKEAKKNFLSSITIKKDYAPSHYQLSRITKCKKKNKYLKRLDDLSEKSSIKDKPFFLFSLAKYYDDLKDYKSALFYLKKANHLKNKDSKKFRIIDIIRNCKFKRKLVFINKQKISSQINNIFIVGMPRTGSTLVENIFSMNPVFKIGGETGLVENCIFRQKIAKGKLDAFLLNNTYNRLFLNPQKKEKLTDKSLLDFFNLPILINSFPNCKVIETVRNKNEVIWSIYKNNFQSNSLNFSYSLENIRRLYNYYEKVMKYFKKKYPGRILTISYEDFIKNPNKQSKKIYDFCQLAWDNSYLNFQKKKIPIKSSSNSQLRDKIYKTAERNFENYRKLLS